MQLSQYGETGIVKFPILRANKTVLPQFWKTRHQTVCRPGVRHAASSAICTFPAIWPLQRTDHRLVTSFSLSEFRASLQHDEQERGCLGINSHGIAIKIWNGERQPVDF